MFILVDCKLYEQECETYLDIDVHSHEGSASSLVDYILRNTSDVELVSQQWPGLME